MKRRGQITGPKDENGKQGEAQYIDQDKGLEEITDYDQDQKEDHDKEQCKDNIKIRTRTSTYSNIATVSKLIYQKWMFCWRSAPCLISVHTCSGRLASVAPTNMGRVERSTVLFFSFLFCEW